jgi:hypothetical protein
MNINVLTNTPAAAATTTLGRFAKTLPAVPDALSYTDAKGINHVAWAFEVNRTEYCIDLADPASGRKRLSDVVAKEGSVAPLHLDITVVPLALAPQATAAIAAAVAGLRG